MGPQGRSPDEPRHSARISLATVTAARPLDGVRSVGAANRD
jgi:hypothetical protein